MKPGKKGKRGSAPKRRQDFDDHMPDPGERSFTYDEIDEHTERRTRMESDDDEGMNDDNVVGFKDLGIDEDDDDDEFFEEQMARIKKQFRKEEIASDIEDEEEEEGDGISDAWGRRMADFRGTDAGDPRNEEEARLEEEEVAALRARIAKDFDEADFDIAQFLPDAEPEPEPKKKSKKKKSEKTKISPIVEKNLSKLTKAQKLDLVKQESPELLHLLPDFKDKLEEMEKVLTPAMERLKVVGVPDALNRYVRLKFDLISNYCVNLSFYMALKSNRTPVSNHPIVKRLLGIRRLLKELEPAGEKLDPLLEKLALGESVPPISDPSIDEVKLPQQLELGLEDEEEPLEEEVEGEEQEELPDGYGYTWEVEEGGKRAITYQIAKNKGLTAHKKKELRNPRVKHKLKYRRAQIRRRGQVREVRNEIKRYGGEITGVRAGVVKSVKFK